MKAIRGPRVSPSVIARIFRTEARHRGKIVAIEPLSGEYFIGKTQMDALTKAERRYPKGTFLFKRIGYRWTHRQAGGLRRAAQ
jgi:hypothetical protein